MPGLSMNVIQGDLATMETEALMVGCYENVRPLKGAAGKLDWLMCGALSQLLISNKMQGALGEMALLTSRGKFPAQKIFLVGLGKETRLSPDNARQAARAAARGAAGAGVKRAVIDYGCTPDELSDECMAAIRSGLFEGCGGCDLTIDFIQTA